MFSLNKTVVCMEFSKTSVFCALAQISGKKVDILAVDSIQIENGILEEGIIYDQPHLQQIVKNLVTSVSKAYNKIDAAWICIPDNKVLITKFEVEKNKKVIDDNDLHKAIEEKFNYSAAKLHLINRPIHELNRKVFFLSNAIRTDNLEPFIQLFEPLNIPVDAVFPTFQAIYEELKDHFTVPNLLLYPFDKGFKFFLADSNGVHLESVWGHNIIEFNENFDKAIDEIVQYAKQSKEVAVRVRNIIIIESPKYNAGIVQSYLVKTGINFNWISNNNPNEDDFDPVSVIVLKGLIKSAMSGEFSRGFLELQTIHEVEKRPLVEMFRPGITNGRDGLKQKFAPVYSTPITKTTVVKNENELEKTWNLKVIISTILLATAILGLLGYAGVKISDRINSKEDGSKQTVQKPSLTPTQTPTSTPTILPTNTITISPSPTPTISPLTKNDIVVQVLNGTNVPNQARIINGILVNKGFKTKTPGNNPTRNIQTTNIYYKDPRAQILAEEIQKLIESSYPSAKPVLDPTAKEDILVVLGAK